MERFLRRYPDFTRLWLGQTLSQLGSRVTLVALPLLAITTLHASTLEVGLLTGAETVPFLILGLPAGVWVDRWRKRPVLIYADVARGVLLATIPIAYALDGLTMAQLFVVAIGVGACTVLFDVAYQSYVTTLVDPADLLGANSRLEASFSLAALVGPGLGGVLVQALKAATAMLVDAVSYAVSALAILSIRGAEPDEADPADEAGAPPALRMAAAVGEGIRYVFRHALLARIACCAALFNMFSGVAMAVYLVYAVRQLELSAATIGLLFSAGGLGALIGTVLTERAGHRFGVGAILSLGAAVQGAAFLLVPAAPQSSPLPFFFAAMLLETLFSPLWNVTQISLRLIVTPSQMHGRMTATMRFITWGALPLGSLAGGLLGDAIGLRNTLWVGAAGSAVSALPVVFGPLRKLREMPEPAAAAATTG